MSTFSHRDHPLHALKHLVDVATMISPTQGGFHKVVPTKAVNKDEWPPRNLDGATDTNQHSHGGPMLKELHVSPAIQEHLQRVYNDICGQATFMSSAQLIEFLKDTQGEVALRPFTHETFSLAHFLEEWWFNYSWDAVRALRADEMDLSRPISNYFINSSHNTYLSGNQLTSASSAEEYRKVLRRNCRCIEIDVWNGDSHPPPPATPSRSKSPHPSHHRHLSSSSIQKLGAEASKAIEEAIGTVRSLVTGKTTPIQQIKESSSRDKVSLVPSNSSNALDPRDVDERLSRSRASSRASKHSDTPSEPIVWHGGTWTSQISFRDACKSIKETAFKRSPLPIIVSLEVHTDLEQQEIMVAIMKQEWEGVLLDRAIEDCAPNQRQPRLEELLNKILIKVKRPPSKFSMPQGTSLAVMQQRDDDVSGDEDERDAAGNKMQRPKKIKIAKSLSDLAIYTHSAHFGGFNFPSAKTHGHIYSISEDKILELFKTEKREMLAHNRNHFMRLFPAGRRFDSSNPDPSLFWRKGVQMVAMNWQNWDEDMVLNDAMFAGTQGWSLKPRGYRGGDARSNSGAAESWPPVLGYTPGLRLLDLIITFYAGQHLPRPEKSTTRDGKPINVGVGQGRSRVRPKAKVELIVDRKEESMMSKAGETDHPDWGRNGCRVEFLKVPLTVVEELSFVRFKIEDHSTPMHYTMAWAAIRLDRLQPGYRFIELMDAWGKPTNGRLFVCIDKMVR